MKIINAALPMTQAEKNKLAALCFLAAAYKALKMEEEVGEPYRCDSIRLYLSFLYGRPIATKERWQNNMF